VESVEWLERYLAAYDGAVLLISHDRDFINGMANRIVELFGDRLVSYAGDFEAFVAQKEEALQQAEKAAAQQVRRRTQLERFVNRFRYKQSKARQVQSKIKLLDRMEVVDIPKERRRGMNLAFPAPPRAGRVVVELSDVSFSYGDRPVYRDLDIAIERDQKVALVGPNGAGKSTLLKLIAGALEVQSGDRRLGHNASVGYFAQHQIEALDASKRVIEELASVIPADAKVKPRNLLGRFLFTGDDVDKPVAVLSGGERTRLALAKLLVQPFNLLCLDEPTNHLDMWSRDVLEDALDDYSGSLVLITHDRHLIRSVADHIVEVVDGAVTSFLGDYDYYLSRRRREPEPAPSEVSPVARPSAPKGKERRQRAAQQRARTQHLRDEIRRIEGELEQLAEERERLSRIFADPDIYSGEEDVRDLASGYEQVQERIASLERRWGEVAADLESLETEPAAEAT
jgi:ATP-binding cassette subfamily F protein 3